MLLLVLVLVVWGTIGYKLYSGLQEGDDAVTFTPKRFVGDTVQHEEYTLKLDYDDPFLKNGTKKNTAHAPRSIRRQEKPSAVPAVIIPWESIRYFGMLQNTSRKNKTVSVKFNEEDVFLREGEEVGGFTVLEIQRDSLKMGYGTYTKYIRKEK